MLIYLLLPRSGSARNEAQKIIATQLSVPSAPRVKICAIAQDGIAHCVGSSIRKKGRS